MLNENEIKAMIILRAQAACDSCNSFHITRVEGQLQGLVFALTGDLISRTDDVPTVLKAAGIKYEENGEKVVISDEELEKYGLVSEDNGRMKRKEKHETKET
jgi:hypothetical protein